MTASFFAHYDAIPLSLFILDRNGRIAHRNEYAISRFSSYEQMDFIQSYESILRIKENELTPYLNKALTVKPGEYISIPLPHT
ncbi:hypothetical protein R0K20_22880, partial [Staphylococcus sp. SIMBA_130]